MKKVLLSKSQGFAINRKQNVVETTPLSEKITKIPTDGIAANNVTSTYIQRKSHKGFYSELFSVLLRLPDKQVQQRVLQAINGHNNQSNNSSNGLCGQCKRSVSQVESLVNVATQTEDFVEIKNYANGGDEVKDSNICDTRTTQSDKLAKRPTTTERLEDIIKHQKKSIRGRKRNTCVPKVVKRSHAQQLQQDREDKQLTPIAVKKRKTEAKKVEKPQSAKLLDNNPNDFASLSDFGLSDCELENILLDTNENIAKENHILMTMAIEAAQARFRSDGLLPIHAAIIENDEYRLRRQIYFWRKLQTQYTLNDLLTDEDEDCLELAIMEDSLPSITLILLEAKLCPNNIYEQSNNVIHLAIINDIQLNSLRHLLSYMDMQLLLQPNDSGYTPLHIAVRHNHYRQAEVICDFIDQHFLGKPIFKRAALEKLQTGNKSQTDEDKLSEDRRFGKYYENQCDQMEQLLKENIFSKLKFKRRLLDAGESRGGSTALYFAIENEMEHLIYFLLAHLCNPDAENHGGQSAKSYHYEFARTLQLNLKVARVMDKMTTLLDKYNY